MENLNNLSGEFDPYKGMTDDERMKAGCMQGIILAVAIIIMLAVCSLCSSCTTTEYVTVPEYHTDTVLYNHTTHDSVYVHDSIRVWQKGDTVTIHEWHTKYKLKEVHDTTYISKTDSVPMPYPVEVTKEVPAELTWWQSAKRHVGGVILWVAIIAFVYFTIQYLLHKYK